MQKIQLDIMEENQREFFIACKTFKDNFEVHNF